MSDEKNPNTATERIKKRIDDLFAKPIDPDGSPLAIAYGEQRIKPPRLTFKDSQWIPEPDPVELQWTTEYPTQPGAYWIRNYQFKNDAEPTPKPVLVWVQDDLSFSFPGIYQVFHLPRVAMASAEWHGPIEPLE